MNSYLLNKCYGLKKEFADRYDYHELAEACRLTPPQITEDVLALLDNPLKS